MLFRRNPDKRHPRNSEVYHKCHQVIASCNKAQHLPLMGRYVEMSIRYLTSEQIQVILELKWKKSREVFNLCTRD